MHPSLTFRFITRTSEPYLRTFPNEKTESRQIKMVPSAAGPSWMRRFGGRSFRRTLLLSIWLCLAYGLFLLLARNRIYNATSTASSFSSSSSSSLGSSSPGFYSDIDLLNSLNSRIALTAPSTLYLAPVASSLASAPAPSSYSGAAAAPPSSSLSFGLVSDSSSSSQANYNSNNIPSVMNSISSSSSVVSNVNTQSNTNSNINWAPYGLTLASLISTSTTTTSSTTTKPLWLNEDEPLEIGRAHV